MVEGNEGTVGGNHGPWIPPFNIEKSRPEDEYTSRSRLPKHGPYNIAHSNRSSEDIKGHGKRPSAPRPPAVRRRTHVSLGPGTFDRRISYGRERADNDLMATFYRESDYSRVHVGQSQQERQLSSVPTDISIAYSLEPLSSGSPLNLPAGPAPGAPRAYPEEPPRLAPRPLTAIQEERNSPQVLHAQSSPRPSSSPTSVNSTTLTWNLCPNKILHHDAVDPEIKQRVKKRVQRSHTTNGDGAGAHFYVAAAEAGLVPNFSYPVAGSAFYNREVQETEPLTHVADFGAADQATGRDDAESAHSALQSQDLGFDFNFNIPDDLPTPPSPKSYHSTTLSNNSTSPTSAFISRQTTPADPDVTQRLNTLLTEVLSPSELDLLNSIIASSPSNPPPLPPSTTTSTRVDISQTHIRLAHSLYTLLMHLQDRISHLEDSLLPQLSTVLERKTFTIDVLSVLELNLSARIEELKTAVDFGNKIVAGCWGREYEMMRTLVGVRESRREERGGVWKRIFGCGGDERRWRGREIDSLVLMAEQNVKILREDVDDMVSRVEKCKASFVAHPAVSGGDGSWRDV
jgi:hypothetical protein